MAHDRSLQTRGSQIAVDAAREMLSSGTSADQVVLRAILDTAVDAIVTIDSRGTVEVWNRAAERLFGYTADEVVGKNVSMLMPEPHASRHDFYVQRYLTTGQTAVIGHNRQLNALRKDGTTFPMELTVSEFRLNGKRMFTGMVRDISHQRGLERQILEASVAEQRRIGQDLHDGVCQQLTAVSFAVSSLQRKLAGQPDEVQAKVRDISRLINEAIAQSRALARGLCPVPVDAGGLTPALLGLAENVRTAFGIECVVTTDGDVKVTDANVGTHLYRIAQEATTNAVRHGQAGRVEIALSRGPRGLTMTITDDGTGLPPLHLRQGGVGLHIMNYRAQLVGGTFDIRARTSGGTVACCVVPAEAMNGAAPGGERPQPR